MWVYSASTKIDEYLSIIHVEKEDLKLNWSGPVQDLKLHKSQVSFLKFVAKNSIISKNTKLMFFRLLDLEVVSLLQIILQEI